MGALGKRGSVVDTFNYDRLLNNKEEYEKLNQTLLTMKTKNSIDNLIPVKERYKIVEKVK